MAHKQGFDCWRPRQEFRGRRGFHANAMLWPHPTDAKKYPGGFLQLLAEQEIAAKNSDNARRSLRVLVNTVDAEPFDPAGDAEQPPEWGNLWLRREDYNDGNGNITVPARGLVITAGVDVQKNRLEVEWQAHGRNEEMWSLDHVILPGEVMDDGVWDDLARQLERQFRHASGAMLGVSRALIDAGKWPEWVLRYLQRHPKPGVRACRGSSTIPHPFVDALWRKILSTKIRVATGERKIEIKGHWIGPSTAKDLIYTRLRMPPPDPDQPMPAGWRHFGMHCTEEYFVQLCSERVRIDYRGGEEFRIYEKADGVRNEVLDCTVYAEAAFRVRSWDFTEIENEIAERAKQSPSPAPIPREVPRGPAIVSRLGW